MPAAVSPQIARDSLGGCSILVLAGHVDVDSVGEPELVLDTLLGYRQRASRTAKPWT